VLNPTFGLEVGTHARFSAGLSTAFGNGIYGPGSGLTNAAGETYIGATESTNIAAGATNGLNTVLRSVLQTGSGTLSNLATGIGAGVTNLNAWSTNANTAAITVSSNINVYGQVLAKQGGDWNIRPSYSFIGETNKGWSGSVAGQIEGMFGGIRACTFSVNGISLLNDAKAIDINGISWWRLNTGELWQYNAGAWATPWTNREISFYSGTNRIFCERGFDSRSNAFFIRANVWTNGTPSVGNYATNFPLQILAGGTNLGLTIQTNGVVTLGQPMWQDVLAPLNTLSSPSSQPGKETWIGGITEYAFDKDSDEMLHGVLQVPHGVITNDAWGIRFHVHFSGLTTPTESSNVVWGLEYVLASPNNTFASGTTTIYATNGISAVRKHVLAIFPTITGFKESAIITYRLFRDADNASDTYGGDAFGLSLDAHIPMIQLGSLNETGDY
jgi:hypothetical protein